MDDRERFYERTVSDLVQPLDATILVCGGGDLDKRVLERIGYRNVTISNLDSRMTGCEYAPYLWKLENAESLSFPDDSFDYALIHAAVHHAASPHRVLTEMYRVARRGMLVIEARDALLVRIMEALGVTESYEHSAVYYNGGEHGGVNDTGIPNYIYRWTEREVEKTIQAYAPHVKHTFAYRYGTAAPNAWRLARGGRAAQAAMALASLGYRGLARLTPKQQNLFAFYVAKPQHGAPLFPWLKLDSGTNRIGFNAEWAEQRYGSGKNRNR